MPKILYKRQAELTKKINRYFNEEQHWTPRMFRLYLGVSKQTLQNWKKSKPEYYEKVMEGQDRILAVMEQRMLYSQDMTRGQSTSHMFIMRAYDKELYVPELAHKNQYRDVATEPAIISIDFKQSTKKGKR